MIRGAVLVIGGFTQQVSKPIGMNALGDMLYNALGPRGIRVGTYEEDDPETIDRVDYLASSLPPDGLFALAGYSKGAGDTLPKLARRWAKRRARHGLSGVVHYAAFIDAVPLQWAGLGNLLNVLSRGKWFDSMPLPPNIEQADFWRQTNSRPRGRVVEGAKPHERARLRHEDMDNDTTIHQTILSRLQALLA